MNTPQKCCPAPLGIRIPLAVPPTPALANLRSLPASSERAQSVDGGEFVVAQWILDFDDLDPEVAQVLPRLAFEHCQTAGGATYRLRLGGGSLTADGDVVASVTVASVCPAAIPATVLGAALPRPAGPQRVKVTAEPLAGGATALIRSIEVLFLGV